MTNDPTKRRRRNERIEETSNPLPSSIEIPPGYSENKLKHLNQIIQPQPIEHEGARWLDEWQNPIFARKPEDLDRTLEALRVLDEHMMNDLGARNASAWANSFLAQTLTGLVTELREVQSGNWSKVLVPDKARRGNWAARDATARARIKGEAIFAIPFFVPACSSASAAKTQIAEVVSSLGIGCSRPTLENWAKDLKQQNMFLSFQRSLFFSVLPEDLKVPDNIQKSDLDRLSDTLWRVLRPWVGDDASDREVEKSAKNSDK